MKIILRDNIKSGRLIRVATKFCRSSLLIFAGFFSMFVEVIYFLNVYIYCTDYVCV